MSARPDLKDASPEALPGYHHILLAADSSDHANHGTSEAVALARLWGAAVTAAHVYAAKMHDVRFRQMEGGLPEQFREEQELERQRDVHDDLITRGLSIITDSYLDQAERACRSKSVDFTRCSLEGKNYRQLVKEANSGKHDLMVLGALGLGAVQAAAWVRSASVRSGAPISTPWSSRIRGAGSPKAPSWWPWTDPRVPTADC